MKGRARVQPYRPPYEGQRDRYARGRDGASEWSASDDWQPLDPHEPPFPPWLEVAFNLIPFAAGAIVVLAILAQVAVAYGLIPRGGTPG